MTWQEVVAELKRLRLDTDTMRALELARDEEAEELRGKHAWTRARRLECMSMAEAYFAEDVTRWLTEPPGPPSPRGVLGHRHRYCVAWAVAALIREERAKRGE